MVAKMTESEKKREEYFEKRLSKIIANVLLTDQERAKLHYDLHLFNEDLWNEAFKCGEKFALRKQISLTEKQIKNVDKVFWMPGERATEEAE